ncbi:ferritin-like domain-containing protein [Sulfobacillus thermosulfidooxidans]|uniref:ferritin family protein n=1 Tax=Sulfobacillus thermosulfidooxidans TaxID=28034 RepID=UPI0006B650CA|nr:ferritin-like domain-containing protein [Sulfobacillus thermosulfidooxidans]
MAHEGLHEDPQMLNSTILNQHRAILSLMEELEAIDWYAQRAAACDDGELQAILLHNMNDEMEHASMLMEWIRRSMPHFDKEMQKFLFTKEAIAKRAD